MTLQIPYRLKWAGIFAYYAALFYIVFLARRRRMPVAETERLNLVPFKKSLRLLSQHLAFTRENVYNFYPDLAGNLLLFVPFPVCLSFLLPGCTYSQLLLIAFGTSVAIECIQYFAHIGVADIDDILLNTAGAFIGIVFLKFFKLKQRATGPGKL